MIIKKYRFGEVVFQIETPFLMITDSRFEDFAADEDADADYRYEILPPEPGREPTETTPVILDEQRNEIKAYMNTSLLPKITVAQFLSGAKADKRLPEKDQVMLHCSYVLYKGQALLFCAPSGTGKSTQAAFWNRLRQAEIINEDRAIIGKSRGVFRAYGCWAMGHGTVCRNDTAPIRGIILLGQGRENRVFSLRPVEAMKRILPQCSFDEKRKDQRRKIIEIIADLIDSVPILGFDCLNHESAVEELEKYI